jgi:Ran GTPase-activating protein (RanGAP) involved in mRNA processing and transport
MKFLSECNQISNIKQLNLSSCNINDDTIGVLRNCNFNKLEVLDLSDNNIGENGVKYLIDCKQFDKLEKLYLSVNSLITT